MAFGVRDDGNPQEERASGRQAGVSTAFPAATRAAAQVLRQGGNAVDAAVVAAWTLCVCEPSGSGLGGQTTALLRLASGRTLVIDGHSVAPAAVSLELVSRRHQRQGHRSCTIPSTPATLDYLRRRYGTLSCEDAIGPAALIAEEGYSITPLQRRQQGWCRTALRFSPSTYRLFLNEGQVYQVGEVFRQPQLAGTLRRLARQGVEDFYRGHTAWQIAEDMRLNGGLLSEQDLESIDVPTELEPLSIEYRGCQVLSVPPPGGGLQLLLALSALGQLPVASISRSDWYERLAEVTFWVFQERERCPLKPRQAVATYQRLLGKEKSGAMAASACGIPTPFSQVDYEEPGDTTHLCVSDRQGNIVSLTQSIQSLFGARVAHPKCGFLYNNYLTTCTRRPHPYQLAGQCLPRSNATPTLVLAGQPLSRQPLLALGAAGSRRIISAMLHVLSGVLDRHLSLQEAVATPRIHARMSGRVWLEQPAATPSLTARLERRFRQLQLRRPLSYAMGAVQAIQFGADGTVIPVSDPRREGATMQI